MECSTGPTVRRERRGRERGGPGGEPLAGIRREVRVSGLRARGLPSLEQVERRRLELWLVAVVSLVGVTSSVVLLSLWSSRELHRVLGAPLTRVGAVLFAVAVSAYLVEKEASLGRLSALLVRERLLTAALAARLEEITALLEAGRAVNSALELDQVLAAILRGVAQLLPAAGACIRLLDSEVLEVAAAVGGADRPGDRQPCTAGVAGRVVAAGEPLLVASRAGRGEADSAVCAPLTDRGGMLGVLEVTALAGRPFSEYDLRAVSLFAENASAAIVKARLLAASRAQASRLAHHATHDPLTDLLNRRALAERASAGLDGPAPVALLFVDLDGFKQVNDELGHPTGDELLVAVARRITATVARVDAVARLGGDEFGVLVTAVSGPGTALGVARRVLDRLCQPYQLSGREVRISGSVGVAFSGPRSAGFDTLLREADRAMYLAKAAGPGCCAYYDPEAGEPVVVTPAPSDRGSAAALVGA